LRAGLRPPLKLYMQVSRIQLSRRFNLAEMPTKELTQLSEQARARGKASSRATVSSRRFSNACTDGTGSVAQSSHQVGGRACERGRVPAVTANPGSPGSVPRSAGTDPPAASLGSVAHPDDRSSACVLASCGFPPHLQSTTRTATGHESFEPACVPAGFHSNSHLLARRRQTTVELLRVFAMR
jgi:hypothetical protein